MRCNVRRIGLVCSFLRAAIIIPIVFGSAWTFLPFLPPVDLSLAGVEETIL
jgi:hypothetical protein